MAILRNEEINLYYETHGEGSPLLLIAGLASDSQSWQPIVKELSEHYFLIIPDNRGIGRTMPQDCNITIKDIADDCMRLTEHLGISFVNILGHSMGGFVAQDLAIHHPGCVDKLILASTSAFNPERNNTLFRDWATSLESGIDTGDWFRSLFKWLFTDSFLANNELMDAAVKYALEYPYPLSAIAFRNQVEAIADFHCLNHLADIRARTLALGGSEDMLFPIVETGKLFKSIPGVILAEIEHAAHSIHVEKPRQFAELVIQFLSIK